jgi:hypothetical protein
MSDSRLREVEVLGGRRDAAALDHLDESPELIDVEASHRVITPLAP